MINKTSPMVLLTQQLNSIGQAVETTVKEKFMGVIIPANFYLEVSSKQNNNALPIRTFKIVDAESTEKEQRENSFAPRHSFLGPRVTPCIDIVVSNADNKTFSVLYNNLHYSRFISEDYSNNQVEEAATAIFKTLMHSFLENENTNSKAPFKNYIPGENTIKEQEMNLINCQVGISN